MKLTDFNIDNEPALPGDFLDSLKHTSDFDVKDVPYFDRLAVLVGEGLASDAERQEYERLISAHPELRQQAELYRQCFAKPDMGIVFGNADALKRRAPKVVPLYWKVAAAAAVLAAGVFCASIYMNSGADEREQIVQEFASASSQQLQVGPTPGSDVAFLDNKPSAFGNDPKGAKPSDSGASSQRAGSQGKGTAAHSQSAQAPKQQSDKPQQGTGSSKAEQERTEPAIDLNSINFNTPILLTDSDVTDDAGEAAPGENVQEPESAAIPAEESGAKRQSRFKSAMASIGNKLVDKLPVRFNVKRGSDGNVDRIEMQAGSGSITYYRNLSK